MTRRAFVLLGVIGLAVSVGVSVVRAQAPAALPTPGLHHVHLNSPNPRAVIAEYLFALPSNTRTTLAGFDGFRTTNNIYFLFTPVKSEISVAEAAPRPMAPLPDKISGDVKQTAFWHFVFPVENLRKTLNRYRLEIPHFTARLLPLYTGDGGAVQMSGDALPGFLTKAQLAEAKAKGVKPSGDGGYLTWAGPDGAIIESGQGDPQAGLTIFGMFQDQPNCAVAWYVRHLNAPSLAGRGGGAPPTEANCSVTRGAEPSYPSTYARGHMRVPAATGVRFSGVAFRWYMNQEDEPLAPMRGSVVDHVALSVANLDAWIAKLQSENVTFLQGPAPVTVGGMRAVVIEGPSREAIELIEVPNSR